MTAMSYDFTGIFNREQSQTSSRSILLHMVEPPDHDVYVVITLSSKEQQCHSLVYNM